MTAFCSGSKTSAHSSSRSGCLSPDRRVALSTSRFAIIYLVGPGDYPLPRSHYVHAHVREIAWIAISC